MKTVFLDIGNTNTGFVFSSSMQLIESIATNKLLLTNDIKTFLVGNAVEMVVFASVVPNVSNIIASVCIKLNIAFKMIEFADIPLQTNLDDNKELGIDRAINAFYGISKFGKRLIVIDFGTALTFDVVFDSVYQGGMIFPGLSLATESLHKNTAKLPNVKIGKISNGIGKNTIQAIEFGISIGYEGVLEKTIAFIRNHYSSDFKIIFTGGCGAMFYDKITNAIYEKNLILEYLIKKYENCA